MMIKSYDRKKPPHEEGQEAEEGGEASCALQGPERSSVRNKPLRFRFPLYRLFLIYFEWPGTPRGRKRRHRPHLLWRLGRRLRCASQSHCTRRWTYET